jgi:hypothetical protein
MSKKFLFGIIAFASFCNPVSGIPVDNAYINIAGAGGISLVEQLLFKRRRKLPLPLLRMV